MWQVLRTLRHAPPGRADSGHRRDTFNAALEQAEQLFAAADAVGTASRPILVFYGVSQLGRAIAAASMRLDNNEYRLSRHGIEDGSLNGAAIHGVASLTLRGRSSGAYPTVARALDASAMSKQRFMGEVWGLIPDADRFPLTGAGDVRKLILEEEPSGLVRNPDWAGFVLHPLPLYLLGEEAEGDRLGDLLQRSQHDPVLIARQKERLSTWLAQYPALEDWDYRYQEPDKPVSYTFTDGGTGLRLHLRLPKDKSQSEETFLRGRSFPYHGLKFAYPTLDDSDCPAHPFLLWWAVLFALSRLARYEPRDWISLIDVSRSKDAVAIEYLLAEALVALPEIACVAIQGASE